jgi:hypothetical protein
MSDFSNYAENAILSHLFRAVSLSSPATVYVALYTAVSDAEAASGTEVSGGSYARTAVTMGAPSNGVSTNSAAVTFPTASASWGTVTHFNIMDASTSGNALTAIKALNASKTIGSGDTAQFAIGDLSITVA